MVCYDSLDLDSASTLTAVFLTPYQNYPKRLYLFQKGDSLALIFRKQPLSDYNGAFNYLPVFMTSPQQRSFNHPYQFDSFFAGSTLLEKEQRDEYMEMYLDVKADDLVFLATDGVFDNVSASFLTYLVNYLLYELAKGRALDEELEAIVGKRLAEFADSC